MLRIDEFWEELIDWMAVPNRVRTYILGSFAQHVTFYSQQVRALNLIDALCNTGSIRAGDRIAIVGGGLAGITAAAGALKRGLQVTLFEERAANLDGLMPLQDASRQRFVHPHVYDWPNLGHAQIGESAGLPLMNWNAKVADSIRSDVITEFKEIVKASNGRFALFPRRINESQLRWNANEIEIQLNPEEPAWHVDILILAVGFGVEDEAHTESRYWTDDNLDADQAEGKVHLVSGTGDGGLTDLMRLCIKRFRHGEVLERVRGQLDAAAIGDQLLQAVLDETKTLDERFLEAAIRLNLEFPERNTKVFVASNSKLLFGGRGSILNRLIAACLFRSGKFQFIDARLKTPIGNVVQFLNDHGLVHKPDVFKYGTEAELNQRGEPPEGWKFDRVIVRHGPGKLAATDDARSNPVQDSFPEIANECSEQVTRWRNTSHWNDLTRRAGWDRNAFIEPPPLDPIFDSELGCVVVEPESDPRVEPPLSWATKGALEHLHPGRANVTTAIVNLHPDREFESVPRLVRAVRCLCRAPLAVFDISKPKDQLLTIVLLGIRAAARRSVTILTMDVSQNVEPAEGEIPFLVPPHMPFNLKDVTVYGRTANFGERLAKAIDMGRRRYKELGTFYHDLPVFDAIRASEPELEDMDAVTANQILLLSSFGKQYRETRGKELRDLVDRYFTDKGQQRPRLVWINQTPSPELSSSKLYSAIRQYQLCFVDWTGLRPNVFFELGVRLAVNEKPPICFHHRLSGLSKLSKLTSLINPISYQGQSKPHEDKFRKKLDARVKALVADNTRKSWPEDGALISPGLIYRTVRDTVDGSGEWFGQPIASSLQQSATQLVGEMRSPVSRVLYADGDKIARSVTRAGWDRLLAAWHFLDARYRLSDRLEKGELRAGDFTSDSVAIHDDISSCV